MVDRRKTWSLKEGWTTTLREESEKSYDIPQLSWYSQPLWNALHALAISWTHSHTLSNSFMPQPLQ